jgi:hypothetical protein
MNSRIRSGRIIAAAIVFGSMFGAEAASAGADATLAQVFDAVCLKGADAAGREAAARAHGLRSPPASFRRKPFGGRGAKQEFDLWKALDERMLIAVSEVEPFPGTKDLPALTCQVMLSPGAPGALADARAVLGAPTAADGDSGEDYAFEETPEGRKVLDASDDVAMGAALVSGRLRIIRLQRSKSEDDVDVMMLVKPLTP